MKGLKVLVAISLSGLIILTVVVYESDKNLDERIRRFSEALALSSSIKPTTDSHNWPSGVLSAGTTPANCSVNVRGKEIDACELGKSVVRWRKFENFEDFSPFSGCMTMLKGQPYDACTAGLSDAVRLTEAEITAGMQLRGRDYIGIGIDALFDDHWTEYTGISSSASFGSPVFTSGTFEVGEAGPYPGDPTQVLIKLRGHDRVAFLSVLRNHMDDLDFSKPAALEAICTSSKHVVGDYFFVALDGCVVRLSRPRQSPPGSSQHTQTPVAEYYAVGDVIDFDRRVLIAVDCDSMNDQRFEDTDQLRSEGKGFYVEPGCTAKILAVLGGGYYRISILGGESAGREGIIRFVVPRWYVSKFKGCG